MIPQTRAMLQALFDYWAIENVMGAKRHMSDHAVQLDGALFGLEVARARLIESNFEIIMDDSVMRSAEALRSRTCLGKRRRWKRIDRLGRVVATCCEGNIFAVQGMEPYKCTAEQCARAMGMDAGHMSYDRLAQSLPPAYIQLLYSQLCMRVLEREYGLRPISFDEHLCDPDGTRMRLQLWLRGAGDPSAEAGMCIQWQLTARAPPPVGKTPSARTRTKHEVSPTALVGLSLTQVFASCTIRSMAALTHCGRMATSRTTWRDSARTHGSRDMNGMWTD